jgi:hypothetical protein
MPYNVLCLCTGGCGGRIRVGGRCGEDEVFAVAQDACGGVDAVGHDESCPYEGNG